MITLTLPHALTAVLLVTHRCQLRCSYCGVAQAAEDMPEDRVLRVMRDLDRLVPVERPLVFAWHGGEPLMRGLAFYQWVREAQAPLRARRVIRNILQTNGLLLDGAFLDFLAATGDFWPNISMDGPEVITRATRGVGTAAYERLFRELQARDIGFGLSVTASPTLARHRDEALAYFEAQGIRHLGAPPFHACGPGSGAYPDLYADILLGEGGPNRFGEGIVHGVAAQRLGSACRFSSFTGGCHRHVVCVDAGGAIHPCLRGKWSGLWTYGQVDEGGLDAWWATTSGPAPFRPTLPEACGPCVWKSDCQGGCPSNAKAMNGGADQPDYYCPSLKRIFGAAEGRVADRLWVEIEALRERVSPAASAPAAPQASRP